MRIRIKKFLEQLFSMTKKGQFKLSIKEKIKTLFSKTNILIFSLIVLSLSSTFISGIFSREASMEETAEYISQAINESVPTKDLLSIAVEKEGEGSLPDDEHEFRQLYGVFRQEKITFATGYNMTKNETIIFNEIDSNVNLSAVYIGPTTGSVEYNGHYKDVLYPVEVMFPLQRYDSVSMQTALISESQATKLLEIRRPDFVRENDTYSQEQFKTLVGTALDVTTNGETKTFVIQDIFYENTYYSTGLDHTIGSFFYTSYYFPKNVKRQNLYFMCTYPYENMYFMEYINSVYGDGNYKLKCVTNICEKAIDENRIVSFYPKNFTSKITGQIIFIVLAFSLFGIAEFLIIKNKLFLNLFFVIAIITFSFIPYPLFYAIYKITSKTLVFSGYGCKLYALIALINSVLCLALYAIFKMGILSFKKDRDDRYYEILI